jgi:hypothetical protein
VSPANRKQGYPLGLLPSVFPHIFRHVLLISRKNGSFIKLNFGDIIEKFNNYQRFFYFFYLSNHTTFSQTQTGATVPLKLTGF